MSAPEMPASVYRTRQEARRAAAAAAKAELLRLGTFRLLAALFAAGIFFAASADRVTAHLLWMPVAAFVWLVIRYGRVSQRLYDADRASALYRHGLARLDGAWMGKGDQRDYAPPHHVYAEDLDLFGKGSLFDLVSRARTRAGAARLADWWLSPADPETIRARQAAVRNLLGRLDLREDLALIGGEVSSALDRGKAAAWGEAPSTLPWPWFPKLARVLGLLSAGSLVAWLAFDVSPLLFLVSLVVQMAIMRLRVRDVSHVLDVSDRAAKDLMLVGRLLHRIGNETFDSERLQHLQSVWNEGEDAASVHIHRLGRLSAFAESRLNAFMAPFSMLFCAGTQLAYAMERWRVSHGAEVGEWVAALGEFEALLSLATYAYERPDHTWPEILDDTALLDASGLGHPLLPDERCVRNDVRLARDDIGPHALLISGSNMSGKSTLMRSIGVNIILALAGGPVRATRMRITPMSVGASIRVTDSLQEGASRFYAEIERLKQVLDLTEAPRPTLFLLDEILHGTNSHDRRIGAEAVVKALLERDAIGCVTTHDLALAEIVSGGDAIKNVHFADEVEGDKIVFDYRMRDGVVQRSNALALMRAIGLPLGPDPEADSAL